MLESLHAPVSEVEAAWTEEIERRVAAFDRGEIPSSPAVDFVARRDMENTSVVERDTPTGVRRVARRNGH